jgi:hypothetical protein
MKEHVDALTAQLNLYIPKLHLDSSFLMPLFGGSASAAICTGRAEKIRTSITAYMDAFERLQLALNLATPVQDLPDFDLDAMGTSDLFAAFTDFREAYAPTVYGCTGNAHYCADQTTPSTCREVGGDCAWAMTQQQAGTCEGRDSRCPLEPMKHWKEGCNLLKSEKASCSWVAKGSYVSDAARLTEMLENIGVIRPFDFQGVLSTEFEKRVSAIGRSAAAVEQSLLALKRALGMGD